MPTFHYVAKKGPQETIDGTYEAQNRNEVLSHLASLGYTPVRVTEATLSKTEQASIGAEPKAVRQRISAKQLNVFTRQFASLVRSQLPILRSLGIMVDQTTQPAFKAVLKDITEQIRQGRTLSEAMEQHPEAFSPFYVNLTRSGEIGGMLDTVLERLADKAEKDDALRSKIRSAMAYPAFVGIVGLGTVVFLLTFVMPRLLKLLEHYEHLPLPTRALLAVTHALSHWSTWAIATAAIGGLWAVWFFKRSAVQGWIDSWSLRIPVIGVLIQQIELARFARSFSLLLDHGITVLKAVDVALPVVRHQVIRRELSRLPAGLKQGNSLGACLKQLPIVTPFVMHTVTVGEETGKAGEAFAEVANYYEREAEGLLRVAAALFEPTMVLAVGAVVAWIVMAILLPIFELSSIAR